MGFHRLKHSFSAGEISPLMHSRVDFTRHKNGCKKLRNMVCTTQGPTARRSGTQYIYDLVTLGLDVNNVQVREIPFIFNEIQAYAMIFFMHTDGQGRVVFATDEGLLIHGNPVEETCPPDPIHAEESYTGAGTYNFTYPISAASDIKVEHDDGAGGLTEFTLTTDYTVNLDTPTAGSHDLVVTRASPTGGTLNIYNRNLASPGDVVTLVLPAAWDIDEFDWAQSGDEMYIAQSGLNPHIIKRWGPECWELVSKTFTDQPADWSDENGWPERVTFHQQRLAFAANLLRRQTVWMSKAGDFDDFGTSGTLVDSDAITFTLDSGTQNKIIWMLSAKALNIGTIGNEWTVVGSTRTALTPTNVLAQRQTNHGGEPNKPLMVGVTTLFVERYGRSINEFVYDFNIDSYKTSDMAILATHLTEHYSIVDWTFQHTPNSVLWAVRGDGKLLGITYQRQHEVVGWHLHETDGEFVAITSIPGSSREDEVWAVVKRVIDGADKYYLEKFFLEFKLDDAVDGQFLDSALEYNGAPTSVISGLDHLEAKEVDVLADGTAHPPVTVVSGSITLNNSYSRVLVGLGYLSEVRPHVPDAADNMGTSLGRMQRVVTIDIDFYKSLGIVIGRWDSEDGEHEEYHPFRTPGDLTGQAVPLYTGIKHLDFPEGYDRVTEYFIRQYQPFPLTIRAVTDNIEVSP